MEGVIYEPGQEFWHCLQHAGSRSQLHCSYPLFLYCLFGKLNTILHPFENFRHHHHLKQYRLSVLDHYDCLFLMPIKKGAQL
ncbi:hypothetical protein DSY3255 [Desulfitobacterium hafniense Y51]|uniref:Uncharacterized protein n=1 Tax=Desulfitobacterium hafniense (strain Y51) TaxID=138119 RepID=Q24SE8_DESHY|nr:hypothetical protein DSY3255 [Desulfitobacterium hafniense Y51]